MITGRMLFRWDLPRILDSQITAAWSSLPTLVRGRGAQENVAEMMKVIKRMWPWRPIELSCTWTIIGFHTYPPPPPLGMWVSRNYSKDTALGSCVVRCDMWCVVETNWTAYVTEHRSLHTFEIWWWGYGRGCRKWLLWQPPKTSLESMFSCLLDLLSPRVQWSASFWALLGFRVGGAGVRLHLRELKFIAQWWWNQGKVRKGPATSVVISQVVQSEGSQTIMLWWLLREESPVGRNQPAPSGNHTL